MDELRKAMKNYNLKVEVADMAEAKYDADPYNEDAEYAFDKAYKEEHDALISAANIIVKLINVDQKTARIMIMMYRKKIETLISKLK